MPVVLNFQDQIAVLPGGSNVHAGRVGVLPDVLQGLLNDPEDHQVGGRGQVVDRGVELDPDRYPENPRDLLSGVADGAGQAEISEDRRAKLIDIGPHLRELAAEDVPQESQFGAGQGRVAGHEALDDFDLEDRVGQGLGRTIMDLAGQTGSLRFLGLENSLL